MSPAPINLIVSDLKIASEWDKISGMDHDEPLELGEVLEELLSDDADSDLNIMDFDENIGSSFCANSVFDDGPPHAQLDYMDSQLDYMDFDLDSGDYFMRPGSPVSSQNFPFADNTYREAFKNLAESMKRSQETRASLKLKSSVKQATQHWEERRNNISTVLSSIENSSRQIQQTYFHTLHA